MHDKEEIKAGLIERLAYTFLPRDSRILYASNASEEEKQKAEGRIESEIRRLESLDPEELEAHAENVLGEFFYLDKANNLADYSWWAKAANWSIFEGACLVSGEDPKKTTNRRLESAVKVSPRSKRIVDLYDLAIRAYQAGQLYQDNTPQEFLCWVRDVDYKIPRELERLVSEKHGSLSSSKEQIKAQEARIKELETERNTLLENSQKSLSEIERRTLLKLLYGMAVAKYDYAPDARRNTATGDNRGSIRADLQSHGLDVESDTIRKYLKEAADEFGSTKD